ncbi:MAG: GNAT family N-acetyltransferase [Pseudomonadota bacterium]
MAEGPQPRLDEAAVFAALEATWPPAEAVEARGWRLRRGLGGGKRVSAASPLEVGADPDAAVAAMAGWGQEPLFQIRPQDEWLDDALSARRYQIIDRSQFLAAPAAPLLDDRPETARLIRGDGRVALMEEIWAEGGVGPGRLAVMDRTKAPKSYLMARLGDRAAAVAFVAASGGVAMIHAIETLHAMRRKGAARMLVAGAARFAVEAGAETLALVVTEANAPANGLYASLGFRRVAAYHYRSAPY